MRNRGGRDVTPSRKVLRDVHHLPAYGYKDKLGVKPSGLLHALDLAATGGLVGDIIKAKQRGHLPQSVQMRLAMQAGNFPFPGGKIPLKEFPSSVEGITIKRVKHGELFKTHEGQLSKLQRRPYPGDKQPPYFDPNNPNFGGRRRVNRAPSKGGNMPVVYNAVDHHGGIVGSVHTTMGKMPAAGAFPADDTVFVPEMFIDPAFRHTSLFHDLARIPLATKRPIEASVVNPKLLKALQKRAKRDPRFHSFRPYRGD